MGLGPMTLVVVREGTPTLKLEGFQQSEGNLGGDQGLRVSLGRDSLLTDQVQDRSKTPSETWSIGWATTGKGPPQNKTKYKEER